jgi:hypothetical protein
MRTICDADARNDQRYDAMLSSDLQLLEAILAEDLLYVHSNGTIDSKDTFLSRLRTGDRRYLQFEREPISTTYLLADACRIFERVLFQVSNPINGNHFHKVRILSHWTHTTAGSWQARSIQSTVDTMTK